MARTDRELHRLQGRLAKALDALGSQLSRALIDRAVYLERSREAVRLAHSAAAALGLARSGLKAADPAIQRAARVAGRRVMREEAAFLGGFARDLVAGRYAPKRQGGAGANARRARAALYSLKLRATATEAWAAALPEEAEVLWVLGAAEHCGDCEGEAAAGWRKASELVRYPADGSTRCIVNCKCELETREGKRGFSNG